MHQVQIFISDVKMLLIIYKYIYVCECNCLFAMFAGKGFSRLHNLNGHMHMHSGEKPHICFCGASFTLKGTP